MSDFRGVLERAADRASMPEPAFDRLLHHRARKERTQRILTGILALVLAAVSTAGVVRAFHGSGATRPATLGPSTVERLHLAWTADFGGFEPTFGRGDTTASGPTVSNGIVYVGAADRRLYAFASDCGQGGESCQPLWTGSTDDRIASTPAVADGIVYVASQSGTLYAFPAECGTGGATCTPLWRAFIGGYVRNASPVVSGGRIYMMSQRTVGQQQPNDPSSLYAFADCGDRGGAYCEPLWKAFQGSISYSTPLVANGLVYAPMGDAIYAFPAECGTGGAVCPPLWRVTGGTSLSPSLAIADGRVYAVQGGRLVALPAECEQRCNPLWHSARLTNEYSVPVTYRGTVFVGDVVIPEGSSDPFGDQRPVLLAFPADCAPAALGDACEPSWTGDSMEGFIQAPPTAADGLIFIAMNSNDLEHGFLYALTADCMSLDKSCGPIWSETIQGTTGVSSPTVADGVVYLSAGGRLLAFALGPDERGKGPWTLVAIVALSTLVILAAIVLRRRTIRG
jgi:outer membrane protein assembly factor BamB